MLTVTLRGLERDGLVTRTVHPTVPPRVDYALTAALDGQPHPTPPDDPSHRRGGSAGPVAIEALGEDRQLDSREAQALKDAASSLGPDLERAHYGYLCDLARAAWADGIVSEGERLLRVGMRGVLHRCDAPGSGGAGAPRERCWPAGHQRGEP
jgi:HxlR-like helix-turn-helix